MSDFRVSHVADGAGHVVPWFRVEPEQPDLRCAFCLADVIWKRDSIWQDSGEKRASGHFAHKPGSGCVEDPSLEVIGGPSVLHEHYVAAVVEMLKSGSDWLATELQRKHRITLPRGRVDVDAIAPGGTYRPDIGVHPEDGTGHRFLGIEIVYRHAPEDGRRMQAGALNHDGIAFDVKEGLKAYLDDVSEGEGALERAVKFLRKVGFTLIHTSGRRFNLTEIAKWKNLSADDLAAMTCAQLEELASEVSQAKEAVEAAARADMMRREHEAERLREEAIRQLQLEYDAGAAGRADQEERTRERYDAMISRYTQAFDLSPRTNKERELEGDRLWESWQQAERKNLPPVEAVDYSVSEADVRRMEAEWLSNPANVWLRENRKADPAEHEAEMLRTALLHQAEFQRTGKRTVFGNGEGVKP